jgi:ribosomal-protein-alanine N-acetyltransferase
MEYTIRPMRIRDALALAGWRYGGIYATYNVGYLDSLGICCTQIVFRLLASSLYYSVFNQGGELIGMFSFYPRHENTIEVGLGMRPDKTGHGAGLQFMQAGLAYARERFKPAYFQLDVADFNQRARLVYERAGFAPTGTVTRQVSGRSQEFIKMSRPA